MCLLCAVAKKPAGSPGCLNAGLANDHDGNKLDASQFNDIGVSSEPASTHTVAGVTYTSSLSVQSAIRGTISTAGHQDWYAVNLVAGHQYTFEEDGFGKGALPDPFLHLYNSSSVEIATDDDSGPLTGALLRFTASSTGTYYIAAAGYGSNTGQYQLTMNEGASPYKPVASVQDIADYLTDAFWDVTGQTARHFASTTVSFNVDELSAARQTIALKAFQLWSNVSGLTFVQAHGAANITITDTQSGQAYTASSVSGGIISSSAINIGADWYGGISSVDSYTMQTFIHEIGHAIGLGHSGPYNGSATYGVDNAYTNDTWQISVMSYMAQNNYGGDSYRFDVSPMMADILAVQEVYGTPGASAGNKVYGFGSTAGSVYDFSQYSSAPEFTIYDSGTNDTLNASGYNQNQLIDLRPGHFSNIGGLVGNIGIYSTTVIANAVGGSGNDTIYGNDANNTITLGAGSDTIDGGLGVNTVVFSGPRSAYTLTSLGATSLRVNGPGGSVDTLTNIQVIDFSDQAVTWGLTNHPDLQASNLHLGNASIWAGGSTTVNYTVTNHGALVADASTVGIYLSHNSVFDGSATLLATHPIPSLGIGASFDDSVTVAPSTAGTYYLFAVADYNHAAASQTDESDNASLGGQLSIQGPQTIVGGPGNDTATFARSLASYTVHDLGERITVSGSDIQDTLYSINHIQFSDGTVNVNDGNPLFDSLYYDRTYSDIFHAGVDPLSHFNNGGWHEGRNPNEFFDTNFYLATNPDVRASGVNPLVEYDQTGWKQGRDPGPNFDTTLYLQHNPDVAAAGVDPLLQYLNFGRAEGRQAYAAVGSTFQNGFDAEYYLMHNPDVAAAGIDPYQHYITVGWHEGRNPNAFFDVKGYLAHYSDVASAGIDPLAHYESAGWKEGRDPSAGFDTNGYLAANPDVAALHLNPLDHYLQHGQFEGRSIVNDGIWHA